MLRLIFSRRFESLYDCLVLLSLRLSYSQAICTVECQLKRDMISLPYLVSLLAQASALGILIPGLPTPTPPEAPSPCVNLSLSMCQCLALLVFRLPQKSGFLRPKQRHCRVCGSSLGSLAHRTSNPPVTCLLAWDTRVENVKCTCDEAYLS